MKNGTGYLDKACDVKLPAREMAKTLDDYGRRVILVGSRIGTIVIFDRYQDQTSGTFVYNAKSSKIVKAILGDSCITNEGMETAFGWKNIGWQIDEIFDEVEETLEDEQETK